MKCIISSMWASALALCMQGFASASQSGSQALARAPAPIKAGDMAQLVKTLQELTDGIDKEQEKAGALATDRKAACDKEQRELKSALITSGHALDDATEDQKVAKAQADEASQNIKDIKLKLVQVSEEIDSLTQRLKSERQNAGELAAIATKSSLQVEAVISQVQLRAKQEQRKRAAGKSSALRAKVSNMYNLGKSLSQGEEVELSFVQTEKSRHKRRAATSANQKAVGALEADKNELEKAQKGVEEDFDKKEAELIELLKAKHKEIVKLEANLGDAQTAFADKRRRVAEAERKYTAADNAIKRDSSLADSSERKCTLVATAQADLGKRRRSLSNYYQMPMKILKAIDTTSFLAKDLQTIDSGSSEAPSFVQITSAQEESTESLSDKMRAALQGEDSQSVAQRKSKLRHAVAAVAQDMTAAASSSSSSASSEGPFDKVSQMIQALIDSMLDQANKEVNRHQWCMDSSASNKNERLRTQSEIATLTSSINEAEILSEEVKLQMDFDRAELTRLEGFKKNAEDEFTFEGKRIIAEKADHEQSKEIVTRILVILNELCDLGSSNPNDKPGQCIDAAKLLAEAAGKIDELDKASSLYLKSFGELTSDFITKSDDAHAKITGEIQTAESTLASTSQSVAQKKSDEKKRRKELGLIETAEKELQQGCGKQQLDTREERMAHRDEEIKALKNALNVLEGEEVPV